MSVKEKEITRKAKRLVGGNIKKGEWRTEKIERRREKRRGSVSNSGVSLIKVIEKGDVKKRRRRTKKEKSRESVRIAGGRRKKRGEGEKQKEKQRKCEK